MQFHLLSLSDFFNNLTYHLVVFYINFLSHLMGFHYFINFLKLWRFKLFMKFFIRNMLSLKWQSLFNRLVILSIVLCFLIVIKGNTVFLNILYPIAFITSIWVFFKYNIVDMGTYITFLEVRIIIESVFICRIEAFCYLFSS